MADRVSIIYADRGTLEREGHSLVLRQADTDTVIPVGMVSAILIGPGVAITHAAVALCALEGTLLVWAGEHGVRVYSAGNPRGHADRLVAQASLFADPVSRLRVAGRVFRLMFDENPPLRRSIEQLRGIEGGRVKSIYRDLALKYEVKWDGRQNDLSQPVNAALAGVNAALYGVCEAAILALGYSPSIGFVHTGAERSFVFDVADTVKFSTVAPLAFRLAREGLHDMERRSRTAARDLFVAESLAARIVTNIEALLRADDLD